MNWDKLKELIGGAVGGGAAQAGWGNVGGALGKLLSQPQQQDTPGIRGAYPQAMYNDAAGFNYPGTWHAEQDMLNQGPSFDNRFDPRENVPQVNFYQNPSGMYKRPQGSMPSQSNLNSFYRNTDF